MKVELADCEQTLLDEIKGRSTRKQVAQTYALAMRSRERQYIDWGKVNKAIVRKWCVNALVFIKEQAHSGKCFEQTHDIGGEG